MNDNPYDNPFMCTGNHFNQCSWADVANAVSMCVHMYN